MRRTSFLSAALLAVTLSACGSGGNGTAAPTPTTTGPANLVAATDEVKKAWADFFDGSLTVAQREAVLEDSATLTQALARSSQDPTAKFTTAKVVSVSFTDRTHADVKYDLFVHGTAVLKAADGKAVLVDNHWKVSKFTYCQLLNLKAGPGAKVPGC